MARRTFDNPRTHYKPVRNWSERTDRVRLLIVHTTESHNVPNSVRDLEGLRNWFDNPSSQASSHYGIDGDGYSYQFVSDSKKAWTSGIANSMSQNYELIGRAAEAAKIKRARWKQLKKLAQHIAYDSRKFGVPIRKGKVHMSNGALVVDREGIIGHVHITRAGSGSHWDPGSFPWRRLMILARFYKRYGWVRGRPGGPAPRWSEA